VSTRTNTKVTSIRHNIASKEPRIRLLADILAKLTQIIHCLPAQTKKTYLRLIAAFKIKNNKLGMAEATVMYEVNSACNGVLFCTKLPLIVVL